jgi:hypothetical protein
MRKINFSGSLSDFKNSIGAGKEEPSPSTTYPKGFTPGAHVYPKGFTPGASVPNTVPPAPKKKLNEDPSNVRKMQDKQSSLIAAINFAMSNQDPFGAGVSESARMKVEAGLNVARKDVGKGPNKSKKK